MLTALPEPGTLQIWTGLMVRTSAGLAPAGQSAGEPCR